jgi:ABC-2 type transport system ATP-binding protein
MHDILDPANPGRRDREITVIADPKTPETSISLRPAVSAPGPAVLSCHKVSKWYGAVIGVNQVTLELRPGITGLVGSNGAGKSTLMRLITGHARPDLGTVTVCGHDAWSALSKRHVGYCPEVDVFYEDMSGRQFVEAMARLSGFPARAASERTNWALEQVGMSDRASRRLRGYSKGMRQRVKLAQALLSDPELLVLDEPLSGIDPVGRWEFVELFRSLAQRGKCLLISSHELDELEKLTDHVAIMARGRIAVIGKVAQIRERLDNHPLTIRIDVQRAAGAPMSGGIRDFASSLVKLPDVVGVDLLEGEETVSRLRVRARNPQRFFQELTRLVLEEWYEIRHLQAMDDSTQAVLGYLLGGS